MIFVMPGGSKRKRDSVGEHLRCAVNRVKKSLALTILRNVCGQLSNPGRVLIPGGATCEKARTCVRALLKIWRWGLTRFARLRQPAYCVRGLSNWLRQLSNPGRGFSSPPVENIKKRARTFVQALISNMAVRGFEPRYVAVYTFRAPSATRTPHHIVFPLLSGTGANVNTYRPSINFCKKRV